MSERLAVFAFFLVGEDAEVACISRFAYFVLLHSLAHGASRLVGVGAVAIFAIARACKDFAEVVGNIVAKIHCAEAFHSRSVDKVSTAGQPVHLGEGGGVHAGVVSCRHIASAQVEAENQPVDKRGLPYA